MSAEEMETVYGNTMLLSETCRPVLQVKICAVAESSFKLFLTVNVMSLFYHLVRLSKDVFYLQQALNYHLRLFTQPINKTAIARMRASVDSMVVLGAGKTDNTLCRNLMAAKFGSDSKVR